MARARSLNNLDPLAPTAANARILVRERLADMYTCAEYVGNPKYAQELHDLRIAAKRLRYTLEIFADHLPEASQMFAEELATLQDELGALHDSEVMLALLRLALSEEQNTTVEEQPTEETGKRTKALVSKQLSAKIPYGKDKRAPSEQARRGLASFLLKEEQRRDECYSIFRRHWDKLEERNFRAALLEMLAHTEPEETK